jgi:hypothetical protein
VGILLVNFGAADGGGSLLVDHSAHTGPALDSRNPGARSTAVGSSVGPRTQHAVTVPTLTM